MTVFPNAGTLAGHNFDNIDGAGLLHHVWMGEVGDTLNTLQAGSPPSGAAGGDLTGTYPNPSVGNLPESRITNLVTDLAAKAALASPAFTGVPTAPTAANGTNTTQLATTAYVLANAGTPGLTSAHLFVGNVSNVATDVALSGDATLANTGALTLASVGPGVTGPLGTALRVPVVTIDVKGRVTGLTDIAIALAATGDATGTLPGALTLKNTGPGATGPSGSATVVPVITIDAQGRVTALTTSAIAIPESAVTNLTTDLAAKAPLASPALTGVPTAPTAAVATNTTQIATTAFVIANAGSGGLSTTLTSAHLYVGNGSNVATDTAVTGDVTISNTGVTAIGATKVTNAMLAGSIDLTSKVTGALPLGNGGSGQTTAAAALTAFGGANRLTRATVVTGTTVTAAINTIVPVDTTSNSCTVTLPTAPANGSLIEVRQIIRGGTNTVTVTCGGSDTFSRTSGPTTAVLTLAGHTLLVQYDTTSATWTPIGPDLPLSQLDLRYPPIASPALTGVPTAPTNGTATDASTQIATDAFVQAAIAASGAFDSKPPVDYASAAALPANTYNNGTSGVGATLTGNANGPLVIDGVTILVGQVGRRVLVTAEATSANNGWYTITQQGVVAVSPYILTRATESDQAAEIGSGYITSVIAPNGVTVGTANNGKAFISVAAADPFVVGTTNLTFSTVGNAVTGGTGITVTGSSVALTAPVTVALGGTGQTTALAARGASGLNVESLHSVADADYTILATDRTTLWTSISAARVATLPAASALNAGQSLYVGDQSGSASATNTITITRAGADTINGVTTAVISTANGLRELISDGTSKWSVRVTGITAGGTGAITAAAARANLTVLTTKGDVQTFDTAEQRLAVGTNAQVLTADSTTATGLKWATPSAGSSIVTAAAATSDQTLTSSNTTLQNITGLTFNLPGDSTSIYRVDALLIISAANATMDAKIAFAALPSGAVSYLVGDSGSTALGFATNAPNAVATAPVGIGNAVTAAPFGTPAGTFPVEFIFVIIDGGTSGACQLQIAQNTSDAGAFTMKKGSCLKITKVN